MCKSLTSDPAACDCDDCLPPGSMDESIPAEHIPAADRGLRLGDTVAGIYHGVAFTGILSSYDGSGYCYVKFPAPHKRPFVMGSYRDGLAIHPDDRERFSFRMVSRPVVAPAVKQAPFACLGGAYLAGAYS